MEKNELIKLVNDELNREKVNSFAITLLINKYNKKEGNYFIHPEIINFCITKASEVFKIPESTLIGRSRKGLVNDVRLIIYLCLESIGIKDKAIALFMNRGRSNIALGRCRGYNLLETDSMFKSRYDLLQTELEKIKH